MVSYAKFLYPTNALVTHKTDSHGPPPQSRPSIPRALPGSRYKPAPTKSAPAGTELGNLMCPNWAYGRRPHQLGKGEHVAYQGPSPDRAPGSGAGSGEGTPTRADSLGFVRPGTGEIPCPAMAGGLGAGGPLLVKRSFLPPSSQGQGSLACSPSQAADPSWGLVVGQGCPLPAGGDAGDVLEYNPNLLDDPQWPCGKHKRVLIFASYMVR